jgi:hypothetical protein
VTKIVKRKLENPKELDKYNSYVDELDKIMHLLLKLGGRLARAENAVLSLPDDTAERERVGNTIQGVVKADWRFLVICFSGSRRELVKPVV